MAQQVAVSRKRPIDANAKVVEIDANRKRSVKTIRASRAKEVLPSKVVNIVIIVDGNGCSLVGSSYGVAWVERHVCLDSSLLVWIFSTIMGIIEIPVSTPCRLCKWSLLMHPCCGSNPEIGPRSVGFWTTCGFPVRFVFCWHCGHDSLCCIQCAMHAFWET